MAAGERKNGHGSDGRLPGAAPAKGSLGISVRELHYQVDRKEILRGINLDAKPGEIITVMGMSGCGKTSLLHCIGALLRPSGGEVWVGDVQTVGLDEAALNRVRERMGMVFQYAALFDSLSVFENIAFGLRRRRKLPPNELRETVRENLALVGLSGIESLFPSQLSGGMAKRVGLARAIALSPDVLLYDEPTSGLDPIVASTIDELIMDMRDKLGVTSIVVSHNITSSFRISNRIAVLHEGRVLFQGTPEQVNACQDPFVRQFIEGRSNGPVSVANL